MAGKQIIIYIDCNEDDVDWLRNKCVAAVENEVEENLDRLDKPEEVETSWDIADV